MSLRVIPLTMKQANRLVGEWHRHHSLEVGHRWSIGVLHLGQLVGAVIVGRPKARMTPQYEIAEVTRCVTNGTRNACSKLYSAAARAAEAMGFTEIQTFLLFEEDGVSLRASGWEKDAEPTEGGKWDRPSRQRKRTKNEQPKWRWFKKLGR